MKNLEMLAVLFLSICLYSCESLVVRNKRDLKTDLLSNAVYLKSRAQHEITVLVQQNRTEEATVLDALENKLTDLIDRLRGATNETVIKLLEQQLANTEGVLLLAFERFGAPAYDYEELRKVLVIYGEEVVVRAIQEITKLRQQNKTANALIIENDVKAVNASLKQINDASLTYQVFMAEYNLTSAVTRLVRDLLHLNITLDFGNNRYLLIDRALSLAQQVTAAINVLKRNNTTLDEQQRNGIITGLQRDVSHLSGLVVGLQAATDNVTINALAVDLTDAEIELEAELAVLGIQEISREERLKLLFSIEDMAAYTLNISYRLLELNKTLESEELFRQNNFLIDLSVSVRNIVNPLDLIYSEYRFFEIKGTIDRLVIQYGIH